MGGTYSSGEERYLEVYEAFKVELELAYVLVQSQPGSVCRADLHVHDDIPAIRSGVREVRAHEHLWIRDRNFEQAEGEKYIIRVMVKARCSC
jgi:hypothetical protein